MGPAIPFGGQPDFFSALRSTEYLYCAAHRLKLQGAEPYHSMWYCGTVAGVVKTRRRQPYDMVWQKKDQIGPKNVLLGKRYMWYCGQIG
jgi:hypothetical protein